ncbi:MAG: helix-turn-helix transcriptional regulator [Clostridia bacterium]|nr:helix-turn-helix transcriptional regulator [Clostridia bacterium]
MEFNEKLQDLRKNKGLTQEELAQILFVSRTAISKWESGRGVPNIESLKAISKFFSVSLDDLLSSDQLLFLAENEQKIKERHIKDMILGLLDCSMALLLVLPFFAFQTESYVKEVSLLNFITAQPFIRVLCLVVVLGMVALGLLCLALQNCNNAFWVKIKSTLSLLLSILAVILFILCRQPYAAVFTFVFLIIKMFTIFRRH